jgi:hypothetical protein
MIDLPINLILVKRGQNIVTTKKVIKGQEAVEFILISVLVFFGAIFSFFVFGDKLAAFFQSDSAVAKTAGVKASTISTSSTIKYSPDYKTVAVVDSTPLYAPPTVNIGGYDVLENTDGSFSFEVAGQNVVVPSQAANLTDIVFETTGASSKELLIAQLGKMIVAYKAANPDMAAVVEISFGTGSRIASDNTSTYDGEAIVNSIALQIDDQVSIMQYDQACNGQSTWTTNTCVFAGTYIIEGNIDSNNLFSGQVTSRNTDYTPKGTFNATINNTNGLSINNASYIQQDNYNSQLVNYKWSLDFTNPDQAFSI